MYFGQCVGNIASQFGGCVALSSSLSSFDSVWFSENHAGQVS